MLTLRCCIRNLWESELNLSCPWQNNDFESRRLMLIKWLKRDVSLSAVTFHRFADIPSAPSLHLQMPVDCLTWPTWRVCRRNPSVLWRNTWGVSIPTSPTGSGSSCFACLPSAPSRRPSSSSSSSSGWLGKLPSRLWSGTCCCREAASAGPTCPSSRAAVAPLRWQSGVRKYCRVDWNEIATFPLLKTKWRFFFSPCFFNYSSCCFCNSRATVLQMSHLNPTDGQIIFQMSRDWFFLQWILHKVFWGAGGHIYWTQCEYLSCS